MKSIILCLIILLLSAAARSQSCLPEGITFTTQVQINNFQVNYPGCAQISGDVTISGNNIANLNGLHVLTSFGGNLVIESNPLLTNMSGLQNIKHISGDLRIINNNNLINLSGLGSLTYIGNDLYVNNNNNMTSFMGLENLNAIGHDMGVVGNLDLVSMSGLNNLDSVGNSFYMSINAHLASISALEDLAFIGGDVLFYYNFSLHYLSGLENLKNINGSLTIQDGGFYNLSGLEGLDSIGGNLVINNGGNYFSSFTGLDNLQKIGGYLGIFWAYGLDDLEGLENLISCGNGLSIGSCARLTSCLGLESLSAINGDLYIANNTVLEDLTGLENINPASIVNLNITSNDSLTLCGVESICEYLEDPNGSVTVYGNGENCCTPTEIADQCGITLNCLPYGNYYFFNQIELDSFKAYFPGCTELGGNVTIDGSDIYSLAGLDSVSSIGGGLYIQYCDSLEDLNGLQNITTIGGGLYIQRCDSLKNLNGLQNIITVGDGLHISHNNSLNSFEHLTNLTSINGYLHLTSNPSLFGLSGLDNIDPQSITKLILSSNEILNYCELENICEYLSDPEGSYNIIYNDWGCRSKEEILLRCVVGYEDASNTTVKILLYPNPARDVIKIESAEKIQNVTIFDSRGITMEQWNSGTPEQLNGGKVVRCYGDGGVAELNVTGLAPGLYLVRVVTESGIVTRKVVVRR